MLIYIKSGEAGWETERQIELPDDEKLVRAILRSVKRHLEPPKTAGGGIEEKAGRPRPGKQKGRGRGGLPGVPAGEVPELREDLCLQCQGRNHREHLPGVRTCDAAADAGAGAVRVPGVRDQVELQNEPDGRGRRLQVRPVRGGDALPLAQEPAEICAAGIERRTPWTTRKSTGRTCHGTR